MPEGYFEMDQGRINTVPTPSTVSATATLPKFKLMMLGMIHGSVNCDVWSSLHEQLTELQLNLGQ